MIGILHKFIHRCKEFALRRVLGADDYLKLCIFREGFSREVNSVKSGLDRHTQTRLTNEGQLRRNIHRLEKGMTMKPFRFPFGMEYIEETVEIFLEARTLHHEKAVMKWAENVLMEYFSNDVRDAKLVELRSKFLAAGTDESISGLVPFPYSIAVSETARIAFEDIVRSRSSLRHFSDRPVDPGTVNHALDFARKAPSACNRQPFRYEIFLNSKRARDLASISIGTGGYADGVRSLAVLIGDLSNYENQRDRHLIYIDGGLSAMCFVLSLQSLGVGSCCINWPDQEPQESMMKAELGLKPWERIVMLIAIGYPAGDALVPYSLKKEIDEISKIHHEE